jgi:hypothetical protein
VSTPTATCDVRVLWRAPRIRSNHVPVRLRVRSVRHVLERGQAC